LHAYADAIDAWHDAQRPGAAYQDVHAWVLNPSSFALLVDAARRFGLTTLSITELVDTVDGEFFALLSAGAGAPVPDEDGRLRLMLASRTTERTPDVVVPPPSWRVRVRRRGGRLLRRLRLRA
jgi:hypothetical protein